MLFLLYDRIFERFSPSEEPIQLNSTVYLYDIIRVELRCKYGHLGHNIGWFASCISMCCLLSITKWECYSISPYAITLRPKTIVLKANSCHSNVNVFNHVR